MTADKTAAPEWIDVAFADGFGWSTYAAHERDKTRFIRADLCASGQRVRALEVDDLAQIIRVVDGNNTLGAGELAEAILEAMPVPRIVGALTPAPQAEGQGHRSFPDAADGRPMPPMGDDLMTAGLSGEDARFVALQLAQNGLMLVPAPQTAQEAVPVAWRYRYVDPVSGKPIWRYSNNLWNGQRPSESQPLYAHPPQPSETVAEATNHALDACRIIDAAVLEGHDNTSDLICHLLEAVEPARAALRAMKGGE